MDAVRIGLVLILCMTCLTSVSSGRRLSLKCCPGRFLETELPASDSGVRCMKTHPAILGGKVNLTCTLLLPVDVIQVTWFMTKGNESKDVASYSEHGLKVNPEFSSYISIFPPVSGKDSFKSSIEISKVEEEDEACYRCYFNRKHDGSVDGEICLKDIGASNEVTCSAPETHIGISMNPPEIKTRKSERDVNRSGDRNVLLKGRYVDTNLNPSCTFVEQEAKKNPLRKEKKLKERTHENVVLQCRVSGTGTPEIQWNNTGNAVAENTTTTNGNVTTITSSLPCPVSLLTHNQGVSCNIIHTEKGNPEMMEEVNTFWQLFWIVPAVVVVVAPGLYIYKKYKRSSENREDKTSKDEFQRKNAEETPTKDFSEYKDETPTKDFGGKIPENDGLPTYESSYSPRKLQFGGEN